MTPSRLAGLSLAPFRALRYSVPNARLGDLLCPPYDVISDAERQRLLQVDPDNAVSVVLPVEPSAHERADAFAGAAADPVAAERAYTGAAERIQRWIDVGLARTDPGAALYVYEMQPIHASATRGLIGAVELRPAEDGVILPHENTMAGPVADRLALMSATDANLEPIYLVYDGGGAASQLVSDIEQNALGAALAHTQTADGTTHRLWSISDASTLAAVAEDLNSRRALIADGHHRYATYLELQRRRREAAGAGPWDRGLALLVDSSTYGPQVHAIHRLLTTMALSTAVELAGQRAKITEVADPWTGLTLAQAMTPEHFVVVLTDGNRSVLLSEPASDLTTGLLQPGEPAALGSLDVTVLHRGLVGRMWQLEDDVSAVGYAHSVDEAIALAQAAGGTAVLMRPTPVVAVTAIAAAGARMPRKSTLFTPKPASGLLMRRFADQ